MSGGVSQRLTVVAQVFHSCETCVLRLRYGRVAFVLQWKVNANVKNKKVKNVNFLFAVTAD